MTVMMLSALFILVEEVIGDGIDQDCDTQETCMKIRW